MLENKKGIVHIMGPSIMSIKCFKILIVEHSNKGEKKYHQYHHSEISQKHYPKLKANLKMSLSVSVLHSINVTADPSFSKLQSCLHHMRHAVLQKFHLLSTPSGHEWNPYQAAHSKTIKESEAGTGKEKPKRICENDCRTYGTYLFSQNEEKKKLLEHIAC